MITVGFSTREVDEKFIDHIKKTCGPKKIEIIPFENKGTHSLTEAYNIILEKSTNDIVVLCHDDIYFDKKGWGNKIVKHFEKNPEYGILGVAGSVELPKSAKWWENPSKMRGIVNHEHEGKKWESKYSNSMGNKLDEVLLVDGLFIGLKKDRIKKTFDKDVKGFHFYDISFTFDNFLEGVKIGVMYDVRITHKSIGQTNENWESNRINFSEKYKNILPKKILKTHHDVLKILVLSKNLELSNDPVLNGHNLTIVSELTNKKNNVFSLETIPGTFIGDGKKQIKIGGNIIPTVYGRLYKNSNIDYDLIISDSKFLSDKVKVIYPNTTHLIIGDHSSSHSSITSIKKLEKNLFKFYNQNIKKPKVKVLTGFSEKGGSTYAISRLVNFFNKKGIETVLYGPHDYHLNICKSDLHSNFNFEPDDILITHFVDLQERPNVKKVVLFCHEKNIFELHDKNPHWDEVIFLNLKHRNYHSKYQGPYSIIPNFNDTYEVVKTKDSVGVAGIIGSIDYNKQTHESIQRALNDGYRKIILFGAVTDKNYYERYVKPLIDGVTVVEYGFLDDKNKMYSMIESVYQSSLSEVASLVKDECEMTNTKFFGVPSIENDGEKLDNEEIFNKWKKILDL